MDILSRRGLEWPRVEFVHATRVTGVAVAVGVDLLPYWEFERQSRWSSVKGELKSKYREGEREWVVLTGTRKEALRTVRLNEEGATFIFSLHAMMNRGFLSFTVARHVNKWIFSMMSNPWTCLEGILLSLRCGFSCFFCWDFGSSSAFSSVWKFVSSSLVIPFAPALARHTDG